MLIEVSYKNRGIRIPFVKSENMAKKDRKRGTISNMRYFIGNIPMKYCYFSFFGQIRN